MAWTEQVAVQCGLGFVVVPLVALDEIHICGEGGHAERFCGSPSVFKRT